jgi:hypothetical protein
MPEHVGMQLDAQIDHEAGTFHYGEKTGGMPFLIPSVREASPS